MRIRDKTDQDMLARATRVQSVRQMSKLSRREFAKKTGIANGTLQHWEDGKSHAIPEKSVRRFIKALLMFGIHCTYDWIMHGEGEEPKYLGAVKKVTTSAPISNREQIAKELKFFLEQSNDAVSLTVPDDAMEPCFHSGDLVAGIRHYGEDIAKLIGFACIVLIEGGDSYLRILSKGDVEGSYKLTHTNPKTNAAKPFFYNVELVSAAPVVWIRRQV